MRRNSRSVKINILEKRGEGQGLGKYEKVL